LLLTLTAGRCLPFADFFSFASFFSVQDALLSVFSSLTDSNSFSFFHRRRTVFPSSQSDELLPAPASDAFVLFPAQVKSRRNLSRAHGLSSVCAEDEMLATDFLPRRFPFFRDSTTPPVVRPLSPSLFLLRRYAL